MPSQMTILRYIKARLRQGKPAFFNLHGKRAAIFPKLGPAKIDSLTWEDVKRIAVF